MYAVKEVAKITGHCEEQVRRWIRGGLLKADRINQTNDPFIGSSIPWTN